MVIYTRWNNSWWIDPKIFKLNVREIADMVGLNYYTIQRHITEGKLVGNKLGRSHKISQENLNKYLNNK